MLFIYFKMTENLKFKKQNNVSDEKRHSLIDLYMCKSVDLNEAATLLSNFLHFRYDFKMFF